MSAPDGSDYHIGVDDPLEWFGLGVVIFEETVDSGPEINDGAKYAALSDGAQSLPRLNEWSRARTHKFVG
jgi:hypothetical protein